MNNKSPRILIADNYDSFTYNLVQIVREHGGCIFDVTKSDKINVKNASVYDGFLFSPGAGLPDESPAMSELLKLYATKKSFLGVCLGHQAIAEYFGMKLVPLDSVRHGIKAVIRITDSSDYLFRGMPREFTAGLYHSWAVIDEPQKHGSLPELKVTAVSTDGTIMAVAHVRCNIRGIQFHPESYLSENNHLIIYNWLNHLSGR
jgi:anthranilate synthase component 2